MQPALAMFFGWKSKPDESTPFQAIVRPAADDVTGAPPNELSEAAGGTEDGWAVEDIEAAYLRALEAAESVDPADGPEALAATDDGIPSAAAGASHTAFRELSGVDAAEDDRAQDLADSAVEPVPDVATATEEDEPRRVSPWQIIESLLFVGGRPLTSRQLADVLGGSHTPEVVDDTVSQLNSEYARQLRPYEVRLGEGGYRLDLKPEYEKVRSRVFGVGPREVKLAQNALEVLALVAYQQPVSKADVEESGIQGANGLLRQLLRRELIALQRGGDDEPDTYRTTGRFLELFGLRSLGDLPRPEAVNLR